MFDGLPPLVQLTVHLHAAAGSVVLLSGAVAMAAPKGQRVHILAGRTFTAAMLVGMLLAVPAIWARSNLLLLLLGAFSAWMAAAGFRAFRVQRHGPTPLDRALRWVPISAGFGLIGLGLWVMVRDGTPAGFGGVGLGLGATALWTARGQHHQAPARSDALRTHLGYMVGAYIAATTAFLAVNASGVGLPTVLIWLGPTLAGVPAIAWWSRSHAPQPSPAAGRTP